MAEAGFSLPVNYRGIQQAEYDGNGVFEDELADLFVQMQMSYVAARGYRGIWFCAWPVGMYGALDARHEVATVDRFAKDHRHSTQFRDHPGKKTIGNSWSNEACSHYRPLPS